MRATNRRQFRKILIGAIFAFCAICTASRAGDFSVECNVVEINYLGSKRNYLITIKYVEAEDRFYYLTPGYSYWIGRTYPAKIDGDWIYFSHDNEGHMAISRDFSRYSESKLHSSNRRRLEISGHCQGGPLGSNARRPDF